MIDEYMAEKMRNQMLEDILNESEEFHAMLDTEEKANTVSARF